MPLVEDLVHGPREVNGCAKVKQQKQQISSNYIQSIAVGVYSVRDAVAGSRARNYSPSKCDLL
eukprot:5022313-Pleurochrysis_carterae.AAC.3